MNESILVFTHRSTKFLTKLNGSTSWQLNPDRAKYCDYVICARNSNSPLAEMILDSRIFGWKNFQCCSIS